jgi:hypothetical protein
VSGGFVLQFDRSQIPALADRFPGSDEPRIIAAGQAARARGFYTRPEFITVCRGKTARSQARVAANSSAAVRKATATAFGTKDLAEQVAALLRLNGVGMPTASVLLHFAFPDRFPILDVRALESLGVARSSYTPAFWARYVEACRALAADEGVSLRTLDKALWQYSKERSARVAPSPAR